jgi:hypothetical protein
MSIPPRIARPTGAPTAALALLLLVGLPATGRAQCSLANSTQWCAHQDSPGIGGGPEDGDRFAAALAFGDFDGDGFDDLAVGIPGENDGAGFVHVFYSDGSRLTLAGQQLFSQDDVAGADEGAENGDGFGSALAVGDFNDDGFDDLAVGSPGENLPDSGLFGSCVGLICQDIGLIQVIRGSASGLQLGNVAIISAAELDLPAAQDHAQIGSALAVFRANLDTLDDVAVGVPGAGPNDRGNVVRCDGTASGFDCATIFSNSPAEDDERFGATLAAGLVGIATPGQGLVVASPLRDVTGTDVGQTLVFGPAGNLIADLRQIDYASAGEASGDRFGAAAALGDFNGDGFDDLALGAPGKNHGPGNPNDSGRVYVAYNDGSGPDPDDGPDSIGEDEWAGNTPEAGELFGSALAAGDVDGDSHDDLLMGAPGDGLTDVGRIYLKRGSPSGLTTLGNELFGQGFLGGTNDDDDQLGKVIALGDVDGDGVLEIAFGVPDKDVGTGEDAGMVYVTRAFGPRVFADGFESGSEAAWSASTS